MNDLTQDQQKVASELLNLVMQRVFERIAPVLTDEDMKQIEELSAKDSSGNAVKYFLTAKVPNYDKLLEEEINLLKNLS